MSSDPADAKRPEEPSDLDRLAKLALQIATHQALIQVIAANWGRDVIEELDNSEREFMQTLDRDLSGFVFTPNSAASVKRLRKVEQHLAVIRNAAYQRAQAKIYNQALELAANEAKWAKRIAVELSPAKAALQDLTPAKVEQVVNSGMANGGIMEKWFPKLSADDAARIEAVVNQGVSSGMTVEQIADRIGGTRDGNYQDGILETSRHAAIRMARTLCSAVANNAKDAFYRANPKICIGVEWLDTLDGRTCPYCAALSRKRWKVDEPHPVPPLHHQCRCVLLPVTALSDAAGEERPVANSDFMEDAKRAYEKKYPGKNFDDLAASTRKKYYHQAIADYEKRTGQPAFSRSTASMSFREYFNIHMTEQQRRDWLGPGRYEIWRRGNLPMDCFIPPYPNRLLTVKELKRLDLESFKDAG